ncbi:MAG: flagellar biosynthesis protein FliQ [Lachnospiraceae bacterium]|nr:flagellar biosynthesis protein FliQ [Lachnospiraceae bacterium]
MSETQVIEVVNRALYLIVKVSAPMLLVSLIVGLIISILQTVTSIQEQTLTFVPKLLGIFVTIMLCGRWIMNSVVEFFNYLMENLPYFLKG